MDSPKLILKMKEQWEQKLPFVLFSLPNATTSTLYFQEDTLLHLTEDYIEKGFAFAPYDDEQPSFYMPLLDDNYLEGEIPKTVIEEEVAPNKIKVAEKQQHLALVNAALEKVNTRVVAKVVVSRKKDFKLTKLALELLTQRLFQLYPTAFRYIWYHPKTGLWCGASPEGLVECDGTTFSTMALAGTKKVGNTKSPNWTYKEIHEQQLVTDAIVTNLQRVTAVIKTHKPITIIAGSLFHLKTEIRGVIKTSRSTLPKIIKAIHPTPAVCGEPKAKAKKLIAHLETYDREFYTGFLGPFDGIAKKATLFVNLRCAKIEKEQASLYVGGGIVVGSKAEDEWEETQNKLATMQKVLAPFLKY